MRKLVTICVFFLNSCSEQKSHMVNYDLLLENEPSVIEISDNGNFNLDTVTFSSKAYNIFPQVESNGVIERKSGIVYITLLIQKPQFAYLNINTNPERVFLLPNDTLQIELDYNDQTADYIFKRFKGNTADINYYRKAKEKALEIKSFINVKGSLPSQAPSLEIVKSVTDSVSNLELNYLEKARFEYNLPDWFYELERSEIIYFGAQIKIGAPSYRKTLMGLDEKIPEGYFDFIDKVPVNNQMAKLSSLYFMYLDRLTSHYYFTDSLSDMIVSERLKILYPLELEYFNRYLDENLRDIAFARIISREINGDYLKDTSFINQTINRLFSSDLKDVLKGYYLQKGMTTIQIGDLAPNFFLENEKDELRSLDDYKENLILISFWATWCKPCIKEFPYENELTKEYSNQGFEILSICMGSSKGKWKEYIAKYQLITENLFANENWIEKLEKDYNISGLPRYILIDKNQKIIEIDRYRLSDEGLKELIEKHI